MIRHLRFRLGWLLLRPLTREVTAHYVDAERRQRAAGNDRAAEHCAYITIGALYVGVPNRYRWAHDADV